MPGISVSIKPDEAGDQVIARPMTEPKPGPIVAALWGALKAASAELPGCALYKPYRVPAIRKNGVLGVRPFRCSNSGTMS